MQNLNMILIAFMGLVMGVLSAPAGTSNAVKLPRAFQAAAPCDAWSEECRDVIQANACFAMYMFNPTTADKSAVLDCVDINDEEVAERKVRFHSRETFCSLTVEEGRRSGLTRSLDSCATATDAPRRRCRSLPRRSYSVPLRLVRLEQELGVL